MKNSSKYDYSNKESQNLFEEFTKFLYDITEYIRVKDLSISKILVEKDELLLDIDRLKVDVDEKQQEVFKRDAAIKELNKKIEQSNQEILNITRTRYMIKELNRRLPKILTNRLITFWREVKLFVKGIINRK